MIDTDGLSAFAKFFLIVNPEVLALVRFLGIALGFAFAFSMIVCCCVFAVHELKEIFRLYKLIKRRLENYVQ